MNRTATIPTQHSKSDWLTRLGRRLVLKHLDRLEHGRLTVIEHGREWRFGGNCSVCPVEARLEVLDPAMYAAFAFGGSVAAGESFMRGEWRSDDLVAVTRIFAANLELLETVDRGLARLKTPLRRLLHRLNDNTKRGSRKNISAHYDLGNDFFRLFLDESLMYSSCVFPDEESTLEEASWHKNELLCRKLGLTADDHLLEIGTGWGGFAIHAARRYGCRVTTTTISREQFQEAKKRVHGAGLQDRVELLMEDYRDLNGSYDKLVSIEMIEAVGHQYLDNYFAKCSSLLKSGGIMALQAITIPGQRYQKATKTVDFIKRYIFPGGFLPSIEAITRSVSHKTDLEFFHIENIGLHYAETLRHWRERFNARLDQVRQLGYPETFIRMWEYYLCYCEGGFRERVIGTSQLVLTKPHHRGPLRAS